MSKFSKKDLSRAIFKVMNKDRYRKAAEKYKKLLDKYNVAKRAAQEIEKFVKRRKQ